MNLAIKLVLLNINFDERYERSFWFFYQYFFSDNTQVLKHVLFRSFKRVVYLR